LHFTSRILRSLKSTVLYKHIPSHPIGLSIRKTNTINSILSHLQILTSAAFPEMLPCHPHPLLLLLLLSYTALTKTNACEPNNCLRAFQATQAPGRIGSASSFCSTFYRRTATAMATASFPTFVVTACTGDVISRASSACSCISASPVFESPKTAPVLTATPTVGTEKSGSISSVFSTSTLISTINVSPSSDGTGLSSLLARSSSPSS
jgi:hypothetical protein